MRFTVKKVVIPLFIVGMALSCVSTNRWPPWAEDLSRKLHCGMSLQEIEDIAKARIIEVGEGYPWGTHFISRGRSDLWLDLPGDQLKALQISKVDGWRVMATRESPRRNLCSGQITFFLRILWTYDLSEADLFLDGEKVEPSSRKNELIEVTAGEHQLRIKKEGYASIIINLQLDESDDGEQRIDLSKEILGPDNDDSREGSQFFHFP